MDANSGSRASTEPVARLGPLGFDPGRKKKRPQPAKHIAYGILNPYGDMWTHTTFATPREAAIYLVRFWRGIGPRGQEPDPKFRIVPVELKVRPLDKPEWLTTAQAIAMEARQGGDRATEPHRNDDSAGSEGTSPKDCLEHGEEG